MIKPVKRLDEIENVCDYCNRKDTDGEIRCPNGLVPVPLSIINSEEGVYNCLAMKYI